MHRPDHSTKATDLHGTGLHGYTAGSAATQTPATVVTADAMNALTEELARSVEFQQALDKTINGQLRSAIFGTIDALAASQIAQRLSGLSSSAEFAAASNHNNVIVAVRPTTSNQIYSCTDGSTFSSRALGGAPATAMNAITWSKDRNLFIAAGASGEIQTSTDGATWSHRTQANAYAGTFYGAACNASQVVLVGSSGRIQTSANGTSTWTDRTAGSSYSGTFRAVCWSSRLSLFIAVGSGGEIQTSPDAIIWTRRKTGSYLYRVVSDTPQGLLTIAEDTDFASGLYAAHSQDATTWTDFVLKIGDSAVSTSPQISERTGQITYVVGGAAYLAHSRTVTGHGDSRRLLPGTTSVNNIIRTDIAWVGGGSTLLYASPVLPY